MERLIEITVEPVIDLPGIRTGMPSPICSTTLKWFYNRSRRHSAFGYRSAVQFLQDWITSQHERKIAA